MYADLTKLEDKLVVTEYPLNIAVEVTNFCNLNCIMCGNDKLTRPRGYMSMDLYKKIIEETARENKNTRIWLDFYGEALLAGYKLYYMIDYAKKSGLGNICINTNGTLLKKEYAEMLLDSGVNYISIDCDGYSKEVYEKIRVGADRDKFYANVEYLLKEKKRRNSNVTVDIKVIEMEENKEEIPQIIKHWKELGAWTAVRRCSAWVGMEEKEKTRDEIRVACGHAVGICGITWDGEVAGCAWDADIAFGFGNINEKSIKEIWQERNRSLVATHLEHRWDDLPEECKKCNDWKNVGEIRTDENGNPIERNYDMEEKIYS